MLTEIDIEIDRNTRDIIRSSANNLIVRNDLPKDPEQSAIIAKYKPRADEVGNRVVGRVTGALGQRLTDAGESVIGDAIADAQLEATKAPEKGGAQIAFMNTGGIRGEISPDSSQNVNYRQLYTVQPFGGNLATVTLTGEQIKELLEEQFQGYTNAQPHDRILQVSSGFSYTWDKSKPAGQRVEIGSIQLNGSAIEAKRQYRVTVNSFLMTGGDNFTVLKNATNQVGGDLDVEAFSAYIGKQSPLAPPKIGRISRKN
jgi:5'-nucleotidase